MEIKQKKFNIIAKTKKNYIFQLLICITLSSIVIVLFLIFNNVIDSIKFKEYMIVDDTHFINTIENITIENDTIVMEGYAFLLNRNSLDNSISLFLDNLDSDEEIWLETKTIERHDVNEYYECEYDYSKSGFIASTKTKKIDKDAVYEIIINIDYKDTYYSRLQKMRKTVSSKRYVINNELYTYNPKEFDAPTLDIESDLLREVFSKGKLCFYQKDVGMYIYQYKDKLYWVANENFQFTQSGLTYIPYQLFTSNVNRLPKERIKYEFDNLDFFFEEFEYKDETTEPYRVAIRDIPDKYAITNIQTGVYDINTREWIWNKIFQLDIIFN